MKKTGKMKQSGITLIALVVTIIILIILASISIGAISGEHGIIKQAKEAKNMHEDAVSKEEKDIQELINEYNSALEGDAEEEFIPSGKVEVEAKILDFRSEYKVGDTISYTITISNNMNTTIENVGIHIALNGAMGNVKIDDVGDNSYITAENEVNIDFMESGEQRTIFCNYLVKREEAGALISMSVVTEVAPIYGEDNEIFEIEEIVCETAESKVEQIYILVIKYIYEENGMQVRSDIVEQYLAGEQFIYTSPEIGGYEPNFKTVRSDAQGMPARDVELTVVYKKKST